MSLNAADAVLSDKADKMDPIGKIRILDDSGANATTWFAEVDRAIAAKLEKRWNLLTPMDCISIFKFDPSKFPTQVASFTTVAELNRILLIIQNENTKNGHRTNKQSRTNDATQGFTSLVSIARVFEIAKVLAGSISETEKRKLVKEMESIQGETKTNTPETKTSVEYEIAYSNYAGLNEQDIISIDKWATQCYQIAVQNFPAAPPGGLKPCIYHTYEKIFSALGPIMQSSMTTPLGDVIGLLRDIQLMLSRVDQQDIGALKIAFIQAKQGADNFMVYLASQRVMWDRIVHSKENRDETTMCKSLVNGLDPIVFATFKSIFYSAPIPAIHHKYDSLEAAVKLFASQVDIQAIMKSQARPLGASAPQHSFLATTGAPDGPSKRLISRKPYDPILREDCRAKGICMSWAHHQRSKLEYEPCTRRVCEYQHNWKGELLPKAKQHDTKRPHLPGTDHSTYMADITQVVNAALDARDKRNAPAASTPAYPAGTSITDSDMASIIARLQHHSLMVIHRDVLPNIVQNQDDFQYANLQQMINNNGAFGYAF